MVWWRFLTPSIIIKKKKHYNKHETIESANVDFASQLLQSLKYSDGPKGGSEACVIVMSRLDTVAMEWSHCQ